MRNLKITFKWLKNFYRTIRVCEKKIKQTFTSNKFIESYRTPWRKKTRIALTIKKYFDYYDTFDVYRTLKLDLRTELI